VLAAVTAGSLVGIGVACDAGGHAVDWPTVVVGVTVLTTSTAYAVNLGGAEQRLSAALRRESTELEARTAELELINEALRESDERLRAVISNTPVVLFAVDRNGMYTLAEGQGLAALGVRDGQMVGRSARSVHAEHPELLASIERALAGEASSGHVSLLGRTFAAHYAPLFAPDGTPSGMIGVATDVSEREEFQAELLRLANDDPLTGLFNRRRFEEELERAYAAARRYKAHGAVLFLDLDRFKDVNDSRGHRAGDDVLRGVAAVLRGHLRETDVAARLGGDEFALVLPRTDIFAAYMTAQRLVSAIADQAFVAGNAPVRVTASIGVAEFPLPGEISPDAPRRADIAMYEAKDGGRNRVCVYDASEGASERAETRIGWHERVQRAFEERQFVLFGQPIVEIASGKVTQYELLLRMVDADGHVVTPGSFLGVAERSGLIERIDRWVVAEAARIIRAQRRRGAEVRVQINLSSRALLQPELLDILRAEIVDAGIDPSTLIIELTETSLVANLEETVAFLGALRAIGFSVALDDFGVGLSSFSNLKHLPVDYLKIDGSFIRDLSRNPIDQQLVRAIVQVARALDMRTIAEFVEDAESLELLREYGVDFAQGYHIGKPLPFEEVAAAAERRAA
jgi:diguanylate cyclase (GGDEF)-like protein/PAS domain S-box-containing protein